MTQSPNGPTDAERYAHFLLWHMETVGHEATDEVLRGEDAHVGDDGLEGLRQSFYTSLDKSIQQYRERGWSRDGAFNRAVREVPPWATERLAEMEMDRLDNQMELSDDQQEYYDHLKEMTDR